MSEELALAIWAVGSAAYLAGGLDRGSIEWQMVREAGRAIPGRPEQEGDKQ